MCLTRLRSSYTCISGTIRVYGEEEITSQRVGICESTVLVGATKVVERSYQAQDSVFAELGSKLRQQLPFASHVRVGDCVTAEVVSEDLQEVVPKEGLAQNHMSILARL